MTWFIGTVVRWAGSKWTVQENLPGKKVRLLRVGGKLIRIVPTNEITSDAFPASAPPAAFVDALQWEDALAIMKAIEPLTLRRRNTVEEVSEVAQKLGCSLATVYNHLKAWRKHGTVSAFLRKPRSDRGSSRLAPEVVDVIAHVITNDFLKLERPDISTAVEEVRRRCKAAGLKVPSATPVINAIKRLSAKETARARLGPKHVRERFEPYKGSFPGADHPLDVFQIDHTPADVILVDEETRKPIGRAYLTIVLDVCTRMIAGFLISLEAPGALSTALALSHAILPKGDWCRARAIGEPWPIWGKPRKVFVDNAREFRGTAITRGCENNNIVLENRPKGLPQYGGHVERAFRTFMRRTQHLRGTVFSNVQQKGSYNSERKAVLTLREYEQWLATYLLYRYHHNRHRGTGYPPVNLYHKLLEGDENTAGIGEPSPIRDPDRLLLDFLPYVRRVVGQNGVTINGITYWSDVLRGLIREKNDDDPEDDGKFIFSYDPRDLSVIHFLDPSTNEYFPIPYSDRSRPPISLWELKNAKKELAKDPTRHSNEEKMFEGVMKMREIEDGASKDKSSKRRDAARRGEWEKEQKKKKSSPKKASTSGSQSAPPHEPVILDIDDDGWGSDDDVGDFEVD